MKIPTELKQAIARAQAATQTRTTIEAAIEKAIQLQPAAEARLQAALEAYGESEATGALSGDTSASTAARNSLADARLVCDSLQARIDGLRRKLTAQRDELESALVGLETRRNDFTVALQAEYQAQLAKAADQFSAILRQGAAIADATGSYSMELAIRSTTVMDPVNSDRHLVYLDTRQFSGNVTAPVAIWKGDAAAETVYSNYSEPLAAATVLKQALLRG